MMVALLVFVGALWGAMLLPLRAGLGPAVRYWLAVGPLRGALWAAAGAWVESALDHAAVGDGGRSLGPLQYLDRTRARLGMTADDARSPFGAGVNAPLLTALDAGKAPLSLALLRTPAGYVAWRWLWRAGIAPSLAGIRAAWVGAMREGGDGSPSLARREQRAAVVVVVVSALAALAVATVAAMFVAAGRR